MSMEKKATLSDAEIRQMGVQKSHELISLLKNYNGATLAKVTQLLAEGADVNYTCTDTLLTPLHYAAMTINTERYQCTPFHLKTYTGYPKEYQNVVKLLIEKGADVNACDVFNRTPLHYTAMTVKNPDVAKVLIDLCANVNVNVHVQDKDGQTPLHYAAAVYYDIARGDDDIPRGKCDTYNLDVQNANVLTRIFLQNRADVTLTNMYGKNPIYYAIKHATIAKKIGIDKHSDIHENTKLVIQMLKVCKGNLYDDKFSYLDEDRFQFYANEMVKAVSDYHLSGFYKLLDGIKSENLTPMPKLHSIVHVVNKSSESASKDDKTKVDDTKDTVASASTPASEAATEAATEADLAASTVSELDLSALSITEETNATLPESTEVAVLGITEESTNQ